MIYPAFGIDLSDGALKAVKMVRRGNRMVVIDAYYRPYARAEDGAVRPRSGLPLRAEEALAAFLEQARPGALDRVYVGFPAVATFNRLIHLPDVGPEKIAEMASYETDRSLRGKLEDYERRICVLRHHAHTGSTPCMLFAVRRTLRDAFVHALASRGLEIDNLVPAPAALAQFVIYDRPGKGDRIALSIGLRGTDVVFLKDRGYAFRTVPLGVAGLNALPESRRKAALDKLTERLAAEIGKATRFFFGNGGNDSGPAGEFRAEHVLVFGEGLQVPGMIDALRRRIPLQIDAVDQLHRISLGTRLPADAAAHAAQMGNALGLALIAARAASADVDLLPVNRAREAARRLPRLGIAAAVLFAVSGFATWNDVRDADRAESLVVTPTAAEVRALQARAAAIRADVAQLGVAESAARDLVAEHAAHARLLAQVLARFGPEVKDYSADDLRVVSYAFATTPSATLRLTLSAPLDGPQVPTTVRQRLGELRDLAEIQVSEIADRRDSFLQRTEYAVTATVRPPVVGDP